MRSILLAFALVFLSFPVFGQTPTFNTHLERSYYAYPGKTCPGGSIRYKGPEQMLAEENGAVYCVFVKKYTPVLKKDGGTCPMGQRPYSGPKANADSDRVWCEMDPNFVFPPSAPLPPQPPLNSVGTGK